MVSGKKRMGWAGNMQIYVRDIWGFGRRNVLLSKLRRGKGW